MNVSELDEESKRNQNVRVIFLGDMGVGKTSIIYKFKYGTIKEPYNVRDSLRCSPQPTSTYALKTLYIRKDAIG